MDKPMSPIFVVEDLDIGIFNSVEDTELQLEPIDVKKGSYKAYDAKGRLLKLETDRKRVKISLAEIQPSHAGDFEAAIREFLKAMNETKAYDRESDLPSLVEACQKYIHTVKRPKDLLAEAWGRFINHLR